MKRIECEFEAEVLAASVQPTWPERAEERLRLHVHECEICSEVALVAVSMDAARDDIRASVAVPDSGRVWWLAQMRARREAAKTAGRPITAAQVVAFGCLVALLGACFGATSTGFQAALRYVTSSFTAADAKTIIPLLLEHGLLVAGMVAVIVLVPAAVYLAVVRE